MHDLKIGIALLSKTMFSLSEYCIIYKTFSPNDINYLREFMGDEAKQLRSLEDYYFLLYHKGITNLYPPITPVENISYDKIENEEKEA